jgi:sugar/nucleoside kinase (ribokinase family)
MSGELGERRRDVLISGHVNVDHFLGVDEHPDADRTVPLRQQRVELGGTAANIALTAARYGVSTGLLAWVGEGFPTRFVGRLRAAGVDLRGLGTVPRVPTPTCYIVEDRRGVQRTLIEQGPMGDRARASLPGAWASEYSWLHLTTGDPRYQLRLLPWARAHGLRVAADPAQEIHYRWDSRTFRLLLSGAEILFGNRSEIAQAREYLGVRSDAALLAHVPLVVRTEGRHGATAFSRAGVVHEPAQRPRRRGSAVGSGDAFRGGFYAAWFAGRPMGECLRAGVRASSRWIEGRR